MLTYPKHCTFQLKRNNRVMHVKGTIVDWKDDRGFGFIEPQGGGAKVFCHVKAFAIRVRRPMAGDAVTYRIVKDADGRVSAVDVRPVGLERAAYNSNVRVQRVERNQQTQSNARAGSSISAYLFVALFLLALVALVIAKRIDIIIPGIYLAMSGITWFAYAFDKGAAMNQRWRTKEQTLHVLEFAGGWPGALLAQRMFRHKSSKTSFLVEFWLAVALNLVALVLYAGLVPFRLSAV
jgi:uncharacterized membrane protein YsdA (DUF1294 family)/cold shock CspA family protein